MKFPSMTNLTGVLLLSMSMPAHAGQDSKRNEPPPTFHYWHNWTDDKGVSHMTSCAITSFNLKSMSKPADPQWQARQPEGLSQVIFTVQTGGMERCLARGPQGCNGSFL